MATAATGWACTQNVSIVAESNSTVTVRVICYWQNQGWRYNMNYVSAWVYMNGNAVQVKSSGWIDTTGNNQAAYEMGRYDFTVYKTTSTQSIPFCAKITSDSSYASGTRWSGDQYITIPAKPSYTVSYNANGGTGAPGNQTKWYNDNLVLSSSKPSRTGYSFLQWNTASNGSGAAYSPGQTYTANSGLTLYAIWKANTYTVKYDANGGTGAPGNQTKTYGVTLKLSTTIPTRTNYNFLGWSTSAEGSATYTAGANYTNNSAVTLYAVWELAYVKPRLNNFTVDRCTSDGTASETGTYAKVTFDWSTDKTVSSVLIQYKTQSGTAWTDVTVTASGTSGKVNKVVGSGTFDVETSYTFKASVSDDGGTTPSPQLILGTVKFPIDVRKGGNGVAIGKVSEKDAFEVGMPAEFSNTLKIDGKEINVAQYGGTAGHHDPNTTTYPLILTSHENCPIANNFYYIQTFFYSSKTGNRAQFAFGYNGRNCFMRYYYNGEWCAWTKMTGYWPMDGTSDFNVFTNPNIYVFNTPPTGANAPVAHAGVLEVFADKANGSSRVTQRYTNWNGYLIFQRGCENGVWKPWHSCGSTLAMTVTPPSRVTISANSWTYTKLDLSYAISNTSQNLLTSNNGGIKIGKNINTIKVIASLCYYNYNETGEVDLAIYKNSSVVGRMYGTCTVANNIVSMTTIPIAVNVTEGDTIYLYMVKNSSKSLELIYDGGATGLTVEVIN